eukprot:03571.XXX_42716_42859_1 [CDS] Oithona nana genome sequencing.
MIMHTRRLIRTVFFTFSLYKMNYHLPIFFVFNCHLTNCFSASQINSL